MNLDGNVTHKVKRSLELKPEIIKLENKKRSGRGINSPLVIFYGLILFILLGTLLLFLPISSKENQSISLVDSFFVATSAVTVTGLTPFQSEDAWNQFGLTIIMILSFIGGIGCFWDEKKYEGIDGIVSTECGYCGGDEPNVTYKAVADDLGLEFVDPSKAIN